MKNKCKLTAIERDKIAIGLASGASLRQIARELKRSVSSVSEEIKRNSIRRLNPLKSPSIYSYVVRQLRSGWSPEQIAGRLKKDNGGKTVICHETIYQYIYNPQAKDKKLSEYLAETIAKDWENVLDVDVDVKIINSIEPDFQAILIAQEIPLDPDQHALWHSTQETNISHYQDLKIDKLLEDGRIISDLKKRKEIYQDFQKFLVEDTPAIFLSHPTTYTITRK